MRQRIKQATQQLLQTIDAPRDQKIATILEKQKLEESKQDTYTVAGRSNDDESTVEKISDAKKSKHILPRTKLIKRKHNHGRNHSDLIFNDFKKGVAKLQAGLYDEKAMREELEMQIRRKPCVMYSFSSCPFCKQAMEIA